MPLIAAVCGAAHMFQRGDVHKSYVALCSSSQPAPPHWEQRELATGHGRSRHGLWRVSAPKCACESGTASQRYANFVAGVR